MAQQKWVAPDGHAFETEKECIVYEIGLFIQDARSRNWESADMATYLMDHFEFKSKQHSFNLQRAPLGVMPVVADGRMDHWAKP